MSQDVRAGGAFVEVYLKDKFKAQAADMQARFKSIGNSLSVAFGIGAGLGLGALTSFGSYADDIADASARVGTGAEQFQQLNFAASQTGAAMGDVEKALRNVSKLVGNAEMGNKSAIATLEKYGISWQELADKTPDEQLKAVADVIAGMPDRATKTAAAMSLLGKSGAMLVPMLENGAAGLADFQKQAQELGLVMKQSDIDAGGKLADTFGTVRQQASALTNTIGAALAPSMQYMLEVGRGLLAWSIHFVDKNRTLVTTIATGVAIIGALAVASYAVSAGFAVASTMAAAYTAISTGLGTALAFVTAMEYAALAPALLIGAAILGAAGAALYFSGILDGLGSVFSSTWGGIVNAISSGDLQGAWSIVTGGMYLAWETMLANLQIKWLETKQYILETAISLVDSLSNALGDNLSQRLGLGNQQQRDIIKQQIGLEIGLQTAEVEQGLAEKTQEFNAQLERMSQARTRFESSGLSSRKLFSPSSLGGVSGGESSFTTGAFQASIVRMLGNMGQSIQEKQLKAQEEANQHLEAIEEGIESMDGAIFT